MPLLHSKYSPDGYIIPAQPNSTRLDIAFVKAVWKDHISFFCGRLRDLEPIPAIQNFPLMRNMSSIPMLALLIFCSS